MKKVTIEFELPDGQEIPKVDDIIALTNPDWLYERWHISDVQGDHEWLTDDQAREILRWMDRYHDANIGFNWDFIHAVVDQKYPEPEQEEA